MASKENNVKVTKETWTQGNRKFKKLNSLDLARRLLELSG